MGIVAVWSRLLDRVIFRPRAGVDLHPEQIGLVAEEVSLRTEDNITLHAFFLPSPGASRALLFLHGNTGNASHRLPNAARLVHLGIHILLLDYRGYGLSEGTPTEEGVYADAQAGLLHLVETRGIPEHRIVLFGRSLGAAVAIDLAQDRSVAGLILESTFPSGASVARHILRPLGAWLVRGRFRSDRKISRVRSPLLFFHGDRDKVIDIKLGQRLFEMAPEPKFFQIIPGAGHNDTTFVGGGPYFERIGRFLDEVAPR